MPDVPPAARAFAFADRGAHAQHIHQDAARSRRIAPGDRAPAYFFFFLAVCFTAPLRGFGLLAWLIPVGGAAGAAGAVFAFARAWRRHAADADDGAELSPELLRRLDLELAAYDE